MGFNLVEKGHTPGSRNANRVTVFISKGQANFIFSVDVIEKLGSPAKLIAFIGDGEDVGTVFFRPSVNGDTNGYATSKIGVNQRKVAISIKRLGVNEVVKLRSVNMDFTFQGGGLVVALPSELYLKPQPVMTASRFPAHAA